MKSSPFLNSIIAASLLAVGACAAPAQEKILYNFQGGLADGAVPQGALIFDGSGNLYGTTAAGGSTANAGTVFELSPQPDGSWKETVLFTFAGGATGGSGDPTGALVFDGKGNLYGVAGGEQGGIFELSPPAEPGGTWTEQVIYAFGAQPDGSGPEGSLIFDGDGNLYGATEDGGQYNSGAVFELSPPASPGGLWTEQIIFSFNFTGPTGFRPQANLIFDGSGNLYGTTEDGGGTEGTEGGVVFELSPPATGSTWTETVLHTFGGSLFDGSTPVDGLYLDSEGNVYGTAETGYYSYSYVAYSGIAFELTPPTTPGGAWTEIILHPFANNATDGGNPESNLVPDGEGNLYGTTIFGGPNFVGPGAISTGGTIYELMPPAQSGGAWSERVVYDFGASSTDAYETTAGLVLDSKGNFYGTTQAGGTAGLGTVFEFTPLPTAATPTFTPIAGTYTTTQSVQIDDTTENAVIYYTTDKSMPTTSSNKYLTAISVSATETINAIAVATGYYTSAEGSAAYTINLPTAATPTFNPLPGAYLTLQNVTLSDATAGATIYYTTNGLQPSTSSSVYKSPIPVSTNDTILAMAAAPGYLNSGNAVGQYIITAATPVISPAGGTYSAPQMVKITETTPGASIFYTTTGRPPNPGSTKYTGPITVTASETIEAMATGLGYGNSAVVTAIYTIESAAATPVFSVKAGTYAATQKVAISDATAGATIYYTTKGKAPTTASTKYAGAITVSATETLEAIAVAKGFASSAVETAKYIIEKPASTPVFSPVAGKYQKAQSVKITDTTPKAEIYYTTNGTAPTTASKKYTAAIAVAATETIKAIAVATGYSKSAVATALYTIDKTAATPTITPDGGTFTKAQSVTIKDATTGAAIYYTTNRTAPTAKSTRYTKAFTVSANGTVKAVAIATGYNESAMASAKFTIN
jgi:uncharacterized repeat protein (TIGR03803 family)